MITFFCIECIESEMGELEQEKFLIEFEYLKLKIEKIFN